MDIKIQIGDDIISNKDISIFSLGNDDDVLVDLGKILGTKYAREFLKITQNENLNLKEIAKRIKQNDNPRLSNATHHKNRLNRLEKLGLIKSTIKRQRKRGHKLKFYKGKKIIIIVPEDLRDLTHHKVKSKNTINQ